MRRSIECRAKVVDDCYDGKPETDVYHDDLVMEDDGTWNGRTIICDACYLAIQPFTRSGHALTGELEEATATYRANEAHVRAHERPQELAAKAQEAMSKARPGTPLHRSSAACVAIAEREIARRATT